MADAFLTKRVLKRSNLFVKANAVVSRILFEGNVATGVTVMIGDKSYDLKATKEVILAAGSIASPQLLMLSGIGPKDQLEKFGIPIVKEAPGVGQNMADHLSLGVISQVRGSTIHSEENLATFAKWLLFGKGPFTSNLAEVTGFTRTKFADAKDTSIPDIQFLGAPCVFSVCIYVILIL